MSKLKELVEQRDLLNRMIVAERVRRIRSIYGSMHGARYHVKEIGVMEEKIQAMETDTAEFEKILSDLEDSLTADAE